MKPKYDEKIEVIPMLDGTLVVSLSWRDKIFQEDLPRGIETWTKEEFQSHLKRFVIPKLRVQLLRAQKQALEDGSAPPEECCAVLEADSHDIERMNRARAKRERKAAKLVLPN